MLCWVGLHKWAKWVLNQRGILELRTGRLVPWILQTRYCTKCNRHKVRFQKSEFED